ncbi:MAG TPA: cob(I)yrinic acid a,c-diamide adenosyltransferase [Sneathiellales bacterium]|nr:cob(I)yrinic acid a,c-diamide adenosyltransferase [Sneathiellales bacterium]
MVKLTKIYTRGGDKGQTSLVGGVRLPKHDVRISAYGTVDETNAAVGMTRLETKGAADEMLGRIQNDLFDLGADLATPGDDFDGDSSLRMTIEQVERLEREIDSMNENLAPLTSFVLPGGTPAAAHLHVARALARRAERLISELGASEPINPVALQYANRLSDHFFVLGRLLNGDGENDILWVPGANR